MSAPHDGDLAGGQTVTQLSHETGTAAELLPPMVRDAAALVLLVELGSGEVVYANPLAEQVAPGLALPIRLRDWAAAAGLRAGPDGAPDPADQLAGPLDRILAGETVDGVLATAARASDAVAAREPVWLVGFPLTGAPGPLHRQALVVLLPVQTADAGEDGDDLSARAVRATGLSFSISDAQQPDEPLVWVNAAFTATTGYTAEQVLGRNCRFLQGAATNQAAARRLGAAIRAAEPRTERVLNYRADGTAFWNEVSLAHVFDAAGVRTHVVGVQNDVTEKVDADRQRDEAYATAARALSAEREARGDAEHAQQRLALMAEATTLLSSTLDVDEALDRLAGLLVPLLADWVAITLVDADGELLPASTRHRDGKDDLLARYAELHRGTLTDRSPLRRVLRTGALEVRNDLDVAEAQSHTTSVELLEVGVALGLHSVAYVPLIARQRVLGAITLYTGSSGREFGPADEGLLADLARRAALALDNARLYAAEHAMALTLQRSLLPALPTVDGLDIAARYLPGSEQAEVGGDWYDVLQLPGGTLGLAIGDVMGHDLAAAAAMGQLRSVLRSYAWEGDGPGLVLDRMDRLVQGLDMAQLATCVYARFRPATADGPAELCWSNAGHHAPLLRRPDGSVVRLEDAGDVLIGVASDGERPEAEVDLPPGSVLLLFTDGLVESRSRDLEVGVDEVAAVLAGHDPAAGSERLADALAELAGRHGGDDDVCLLAVHVR